MPGVGARQPVSLRLTNGDPCPHPGFEVVALPGAAQLSSLHRFSSLHPQVSLWGLLDMQPASTQHNVPLPANVL